MSQTCGSCGKELSDAQTLYTEQGELTCEACLLSSQVAGSHASLSKRFRNIAYSGLALGFLGFVFNPLWLVSVAAVANGLYVLRNVGTPEAARHAPSSIERMKVASIAGIVLGAITGALKMIGTFAG